MTYIHDHSDKEFRPGCFACVYMLGFADGESEGYSDGYDMGNVDGFEAGAKWAVG